LLKQYKTEVKNLSCREAFALAQMLYKDKIEDTILAGNFVLQNKIDCIGKSELPLLDKALDYFCSWSTIDDFCIDVLQPILLKYPKDTLRFLKKWNQSKNMWKRRASVVAFVRKVGENGEFTNEALALCENLIFDKEDLVQKGVGWCLKDVMRGDKKKVFQRAFDGNFHIRNCRGRCGAHHNYFGNERFSDGYKRKNSVFKPAHYDLFRF